MVRIKSAYYKCRGCGATFKKGDEHGEFYSTPDGYRISCVPPNAATATLRTPDLIASNASAERVAALEEENTLLRYRAEGALNRARDAERAAIAALKEVASNVAAAAAAEARAAEARANVRILEVRAPPAAPVTIHDPPAALELLLFELSLGHHAMLVGPAGSGKTTLGELASQALSLTFHLLTCSPGMTEGSIFGRNQMGDRYTRSAFVAGYEEGGLVLIDEIDNSDPSTLAALNPALANGKCVVPRPDAPLARQHERTRIVATANTFGLGPDALYCGRSQLDAATRDRFAMLYVDYDAKLEARLAPPEACEWAWRTRSRIYEHRLRRILSTRVLLRCSHYLAAGKSLGFAKDRYFTDWPEAERALVES